MGIFSNLKKTDKDDQFVASDEWLMGLADEPDDSSRFSLPGAPAEPEPVGLAPLGETAVESTWHFPDLGEAPTTGAEALPTAPTWASALPDTTYSPSFFDNLPFAADDTDTDEPFEAPTPKFVIDTPSPLRATPGLLGSFHDATPTGPRGPRAAALLEILGLEPLATWDEIRDAHAAAMAEYDPDREFDAERADLARAIRREMNAAYAALRLQAVA